MRDDGVSTCGNSVCPIGRPVIHSANEGARHTTSSSERSSGDVAQIRRATRPPLSIRARMDAFEQSLGSLAPSVGNNPDALSRLWGTNEGAWNNCPASIIPARGKAPEYVEKAIVEEGLDVLNEDVSGLEFSDEPVILPPEAALLSVEPGVPSVSRCGARYVGARKSSAEDINGNSISGQSVGGKRSDVFIALHPRPVLGQDTLAELVDLAERNTLKPARPFEPKIKSTQAGKQRKHFQHPHPSLWLGLGRRVGWTRPVREHIADVAQQGAGLNDGLHVACEPTLQ